MHTLSQVYNLRKKLYVYYCHMCHTCHVIFHHPANCNLQKKLKDLCLLQLSHVSHPFHDPSHEQIMIRFKDFLT
jgi:hypothetical protein